ncbi:MAG: hypothetical protein NZ954_03185 [Thermofilaceae archaeon]|nr:hypothetical protein [Thermofilaceae archaeon]MCX8181058.1 hypothetical protein [Thermofilaceae archaeon]MDW8004539.1 hypothetical protein [Thermofilaceae archaeon]
MRDLASRLGQKRLSVSVKDPRRLRLVYDLLRELGLAGTIDVSESGIEIPCEVLNSTNRAIVFACWLALQVENCTEAYVGLDLGSKNIGLALVTGGTVAYTGLLSSLRTVLSVVKELSKVGIKPLVKIGASGQLSVLASEVASELTRHGFQVELVSEDEARIQVILGDFSKLRKVSPHEIDALKIALKPSRKLSL